MLTPSESILVISMDNAAFSQDSAVSLRGHSVYKLYTKGKTRSVQLLILTLGQFLFIYFCFSHS